MAGTLADVKGTIEILAGKLQERHNEIETADDYYEGKHPLKFASDKFKQHFGDQFEAFADNWCDLVVDAVEERLDIDGFRFGAEPAADEDAHRIWQSQGMDAESQIAHLESLIAGTSYVLVWADGDDGVRITAEHPSEMIVGSYPGAPRSRAAAWKQWRVDDDTHHGVLYLPDGLYKVQSTDGGQEWEAREVADEQWPLDNPLGVVPVIPLHNRPRLLKPGVSEIKRVMPVQDAVNKEIADMLLASEFAAFRQRWATGIEIPEDPDTGEPVEPFEAAINRLWVDENADAEFGEFGESSLEGYVRVVEMLVQHIASQTRTPPHYFYLRGEFPSGESIKSAETGLVAKTRRKARHYGEAWEDVMRLAFDVLGDDRAKADDAETIWKDFESRSESEHIDAILKKKALGVPTRQLWEDAGYTPAQINRFEAMLREDALRGALSIEDLRRLIEGEEGEAELNDDGED